MDAIAFDQRLKQMFDESMGVTNTLNTPALNTETGARKPKYMPYDEFQGLYGHKETSEALEKLAPKDQKIMRANTINQGKNAALGEAIGSIGSLISAVQGGPVQSRERGLQKSQAALSKYDQLLLDYEQQQRQHEFMQLQNEISNRKAYADYNLRQQDQERQIQQRKDDQQSSFDYNRALQDDRFRQQKEAGEIDQGYRIEQIKTQGAETRSGIYARAANPTTTSAANKTFDITDANNRNTVLYSLTPDQKVRAEQMAVNMAYAKPDLVKSNPSLHIKVSKRTSLTNKEREDVLLMLSTGQDAHPDMTTYLTGTQPQQQTPRSNNVQGAQGQPARRVSGIFNPSNPARAPQAAQQPSNVDYNALADMYESAFPDRVQQHGGRAALLENLQRMGPEDLDEIINYLNNQ